MATAAQDTDLLSTVADASGVGSNPLDAVFNLDAPPADAADDAQGADDQATLEGDEAQGAEEEELDPETGEPVKAQPKKTKQPDSAETVTVKLRGQDIQILKSMAPAFEALQADYKAAERKITEQGQQLSALGNKAAEKPAADPEKAEAARAKALERYDADLWKAIDASDGKGLSSNILKLIDARHGGMIEQQAETIAALQAQVAQLAGAVNQGPLAEMQADTSMRAAIKEDLEVMGLSPDAANFEDVKAEFKSMWEAAGAPQGRQRDIYQLALGKVLAKPKKPGPKPKAQSESQPAKAPLDFGRPQAPNRVAPTGSGRSSSAPHPSALGIIGPSFDRSQF